MTAAASPRIDEQLRALALEAVREGAGRRFPSDPVWTRLRDLGTELWLDTGSLHDAGRLWTADFSALTTNNTLVNQTVQSGSLDDVARRAVRDLIHADPDIPEEALIMELGFVVNCHVALGLVRAFGARVSVELHPSVAEDIDRTTYWAQRYHAVCPERFTIKIPLSPEGYCAVARVRAKGIPVNYTLGFSARQNYLAAVLSRPQYCNVFLGRLNSVVADNRLGDGRMVGEKAALATQRAVRRLREAGRTETRMIAASMREAAQVSALAGCDVFTIPPRVAAAYRESPPAGPVENRLRDDPPVSLAPGVDPNILAVLWEVDDRVEQMAQELLRRDPLRLTGDDIRQADADFGAGMFHRFNAVEVLDIRDQGKIPDWDRWKNERGIALDDLMTQSALQSFAVDQAALDDRLRRLSRSR